MIRPHISLFLILLLIPFTGYATGSVLADGESGTTTGIEMDSDLHTNSRLVSDETARLILDLLDEEDALREPEGRTITQPVYIALDAPAGVRERIVSEVLSGGIRVAAEPSGYHTLRIEWEPDNSLTQERGGTSIRTLQSDVVFTWIDPQQEIQKTWRKSFSITDEIPSDRASAVTGTWQPAAFQHQKESRRLSFLRRIAEPTIITGAVAVTIYLLYNVRR